MKATVKRVGLAVLMAVFLVSVGMMVRQRLLYQQIEADSVEAAQIAGLTDGARASQAPSPSHQASSDQGEPLPEEAASLAAIDLTALRSVNEDVVGWIAIPGTQLSYPLVQGMDNRYYLSRSWKREASAGGAVFLESTNSRDLTDFHTIVYAHQMRNDSMFGILSQYRDAEFFRAHPSIYLAFDGGVYRYDVFSAQKAGVKSIVYRLDLEESQREEEFIQYCVDNSAVDIGVIPEAGERILTLSTCVGSDRANRWVVHAVLQDAWTQTVPSPDGSPE